MKKLIILIGVFLFSSQLFSTPQMPDFLIYKGDTLRVFGFPLEEHPKIKALNRKISKRDYYGCGSSACGRGYMVEWSIIDDQLYLTGIDLCCDGGDNDLTFLFDKKYIDDGKVKADWFTGDIFSPRGKNIHYMHGGIGGFYEYELEFYFDKGKLTGTHLCDNTKSKHSIYSQDHEKLEEFIYSNINWEILPKLETSIDVWVEFTVDENGLVDTVEIMKGYSEIYDQEAIRVVKLIPEWDVIFFRGELFKLPAYRQIRFSEENKLKYKK